MRNPLIIGLGLQAAAIAVALVSYRTLYSAHWLALLIVAVPLFLASPFFLMKAALPWPARVALSFWILIVPAYTATQAFYSWTRARTELILIPAEFRGKAVIHYGDATGASAEHEGKAALFRLGANGELRTRQDGREQSWDRRQFYTVDKNGSRSRLETPRPFDSAALPANQLFVAPGGEHYDANRVVKLEFFVGTPSEIMNAIRAQ